MCGEKLSAQQIKGHPLIIVINRALFGDRQVRTEVLLLFTVTVYHIKNRKAISDLCPPDGAAPLFQHPDQIGGLQA